MGQDNQRVTGKSNVIIKDDFLYDLNFLNKRNYIYKIFIACDEKGILGSISIWGFANVISERGVYRSKFAKKNNKHDQDILKDWILRFAINNKIIHFDLAGFNPNKSLSNKENNIKRFKEKFGGKKYIYQNINS